MIRRFLTLAAAAASLLAAPAAAQHSFSPEPWLQDLAELREALETRYANREWLERERELPIGPSLDAVAARLRGLRSDAEAMALFDRMIRQIEDGHITLTWPRPPAPQAAAAAAPAATPAATPLSFCRSIGYGSGRGDEGLVPALAGYRPIATGDLLPAGIAAVGGTGVGLLRIPLFSPHASPSLCTGAVEALGIPLDAPCDEACDNRIITHAYRRIGEAMQERLAQLRAAGAEVLVVDITGNGGGSEWTEAAARMLTPIQLRSAPIAFVRGSHWEGQWQRLADQLREHAADASTEDRARLLAWAAEADAARAEAQRRCPPGGDCPWLARAGYATGLVASAPSGSFAGKPWGVLVFNPAQHTYRDGAWDGPLIVLVDQNTASAAEQFAALLQDNRAALIVGARTRGAGCGYTWGGTPVVLSNSGATLRLPDCARLRADGSNEVRGIIPDFLLPWRANDGRAFRADIIGRVLPEAVRRARALHAATAR